MATSKLLKPTNVTISIPEFTDQPDQRVNSNCIDKEADAINSLSEHIASKQFIPAANDSLLTWINNNCTKETLPFSFVKAGSTTMSDTPSEMGSAEFVGLVTGHDTRMLVTIMQYTSGRTFRRAIFNSAWQTSWTIPDFTENLEISGIYSGLTASNASLLRQGRSCTLSIELTAGSSAVTIPAYQTLLQMDKSVVPANNTMLIASNNGAITTDFYVTKYIVSDKAYISTPNAVTINAGKKLVIQSTWISSIP